MLINVNNGCVTLKMGYFCGVFGTLRVAFQKHRYGANI
jgi:hypothetical protein